MSTEQKPAEGGMIEGATAFFQNIAKALEAQRNSAMSRVAELEAHAAMMGGEISKLRKMLADKAAEAAASNVPPASGPVDAGPQG